MTEHERYEKYKEYHIRYKREHRQERNKESRDLKSTMRLLKDFHVVISKDELSEHIKRCNSQSEIDRYIRALINERLG